MIGPKRLENQINIFVPIETKVRELHGKILFTLYAASAGFRVVVGDQHKVRQSLPFQRPGIYLDKSVAQSKNKWFERFKSLGNDIVAWDEEGLIFHDGSYVEKRFSKTAFDKVDRFYTWGQHHIDEIIDSHSQAEAKMIKSGNPRFDMLRNEMRPFYAKHVEKIKTRFGRIILVNTNFGHVNHFAGPRYKEQIKKSGRSPEMIEFIRNWRIFQEKIFLLFSEAIKVLSQDIDDLSIIIRPHPSENHDYWKDITSNLDNVHVVHEGNVIEWILASECVIHNDCTTAVESFLLDTPVIAFRPVQSDEFETVLPNALSYSVHSVEDLKATIKGITSGSQTVNESWVKNTINTRTISEEYISCFQGDCSSKTIVEDLVQFAQGHRPHYYKYRWLLSSPYRIYYFALMFYRKVKSTKAGGTYANHKFDGLSCDELQNLINTFENINPTLNNFKIEPLGDSCFAITCPP